MVKKEISKEESKLKTFLKIFFTNKVLELGTIVGLIILWFVVKYISLGIFSLYVNYTIPYIVGLLVILFIGINICVALCETFNIDIDYLMLFAISVFYLFLLLFAPMFSDTPLIGNYNSYVIKESCMEGSGNIYSRYITIENHPINHHVTCVFEEGNYNISNSEFKQLLKKNG